MRFRTRLAGAALALVPVRVRCAGRERRGRPGARRRPRPGRARPGLGGTPASRTRPSRASRRPGRADLRRSHRSPTHLVAVRRRAATTSSRAGRRLRGRQPVGWDLEGGARVVGGSEPFGVLGNGASSLQLPAGSSAVSPVFCVDLNYPHVPASSPIRRRAAARRGPAGGRRSSRSPRATSIRRRPTSHQQAWKLMKDVKLEPQRAGKKAGWRRVALRFERARHEEGRRLERRQRPRRSALPVLRTAAPQHGDGAPEGPVSQTRGSGSAGPVLMPTGTASGATRNSGLRATPPPASAGPPRAA